MRILQAFEGASWELGLCDRYARTYERGPDPHGARVRLTRRADVEPRTGEAKASFR